MKHSDINGKYIIFLYQTTQQYILKNNISESYDIEKSF